MDAAPPTSKKQSLSKSVNFSSPSTEGEASVSPRSSLPSLAPRPPAPLKKEDLTTTTRSSSGNNSAAVEELKDVVVQLTAALQTLIDRVGLDPEAHDSAEALIQKGRAVVAKTYHQKVSAEPSPSAGSSSEGPRRSVVSDSWRSSRSRAKSTVSGAYSPSAVSPSGAGMSAAEAASLNSFGQCIGAATYFILESLLVQTFSARVTLFMKTPGGPELIHVASAGVGMHGIRISPPNSTGLVQTVFSTGIAANLNVVNLEDVADCPGPTKAKNALLFPVRSHKDPTSVIGVVCLINKCRGDEAYDVHNERFVFATVQSLAYVYEVYQQADLGSCHFDPTTLHRLRPLPQYTPPSIGLPKAFEAAPFVQKVYHRNGAEKFIRREVLQQHSQSEASGTATSAAAAGSTTTLADDGIASNLQSVEEYITMMEQCWRSSIVDSMEMERQLKMKQTHISEAREILARKQRKLDLLKDALCEQLQKGQEPVSMGRERRRSLAASTAAKNKK